VKGPSVGTIIGIEAARARDAAYRGKAKGRRPVSSAAFAAGGGAVRDEYARVATSTAMQWRHMRVSMCG